MVPLACIERPRLVAQPASPTTTSHLHSTMVCTLCLQHIPSMHTEVWQRNDDI